MTFKQPQIISEKRINQIEVLLETLRIDLFTIEKSKTINTNNLAILNEALTHTSAQAAVNHERLEFLGDAVLRLAASEFIDQHFPRMKVGDRSALRAQLVSDRWLSEVGQKIGLEELLIIGPKAAGDASARATLHAEATEALIGAIYECIGDIKPIQKWLSPLWEIESNSVLADPDKHNSKSALQEWSQGRGREIPCYETEEKSKEHGNPERFYSKVHVEGKQLGEGWGSSRQNAEKAAASRALSKIRKSQEYN